MAAQVPLALLKRTASGAVGCVSGPDVLKPPHQCITPIRPLPHPEATKSRLRMRTAVEDAELTGVIELAVQQPLRHALRLHRVVYL